MSHTVAVVTDGSAVLGLGNIGPRAALPVMEGKAVLFKQFGGVDAVPICLDTQDVDEIVAIGHARWRPSFGGINLEDISAPRCFEIERRLDEALDIPVFHDDQHGTAIVVLAALRNAATLLDRKLGDLRVVGQRRRRGRGRGDQDADRRRGQPGPGGGLRLPGRSSAGDRDRPDRDQGRAGGDHQRRGPSAATSPRRCAARTC